MPDAIVEPAANAAAPTQPPAAPAATPPDAAPPVAPAEGQAARLRDLLTAAPKEPEAPKKPKAEAPAAAAPVVEPKKEKKEKPIKVHKPAEPAPETRPPLPTTEPAASAPEKPAAAAPAAPAEDDATFEAGLLEEERAHVQRAKDAERLLGDKYKGLPSKTLAFLKESAKKEKEIEASVKEGDMTPAEAKAAYGEWYEANRPKIGALDMERLVEARAEESALRKIEPKLQEERHARWVEAETPKIEAKGQQIKADLWNDSLPEDVTAAATERLQGVTDEVERQRIIAEVKKDFALELEVTESITAAARDDIQEFYRLMATNPATGLPLKKRNRDLGTEEGQQHNRLYEMAKAICEEFKTTGGAALKKDGKWFATWNEWAAMTPAQQVGWWTFDNDELIGRAKQKVKGVVADAIKQRWEALEAHGKLLERRGARKAKPAAAAAPAAPHVGAPAAPRIAPPPSGGGSAPASAAERLANLMGGKPAE